MDQLLPKQKMLPRKARVSRRRREITRALSQTDIEALEFAWRTFGQYTQYQLRDITHHYPEWKRHAAKLRHDSHKRVQMDYADFFNDPAQGYNPCHPLSSKDRKIALDLFLDQEAFNQRWS